MQVQSMVQGYGERVKHIEMFNAVLKLDKSSQVKHAKSIALYVLLFMLESKLSLNKGVTKEEVQHFILSVVKVHFDETFTWEQAVELEDWLVYNHLRNRGKQHEYIFYDFEKKEEKRGSYHLIEYAEGTQVFSDKDPDAITLSSTGVEMLFNTREVFSELRITLTQLLWKQQFEKGLFSDALRRIHEMNVLIEDEKKKLQTLQSRIIKDALGIAQQHELQIALKRIDSTLQDEKVRFKEMEQLVDEKLDEYHQGLLTEKERDGIDIIQEIEKSLTQAISLHESLFTDKQKIQNIMSESLESSIIYAFSVKLDFDKEILQELIDSPVSEEVLNHISKPLLPLKHNKIFNPMVIFASQKRFKRKQQIDEVVPEITEEEKIRQLEEQQKKLELQEQREQDYIQFLLTPLVESESYLLKELIEEASVDKKDEITANPRLFLDFLVALHQSEYNLFEKTNIDIWDTLPRMNRLLTRLTSECCPELESVGSFSIVPTNQYFYIGTIKYQDVEIKRGDVYDVGKGERR